METVELEKIAKRLAERLAEAGRRVVFAESCTAGLVSSSLAAVPGISDWLCGSAVTYRNQTKIGWLDVDSDVVERETAVSETVAGQMAVGVLAKTPEADLAVSVTGHLGPHAPAASDGVLFVGVARRIDGVATLSHVDRCRLQQTERLGRQREAAGLVLEIAMRAL